MEALQALRHARRRHYVEQLDVMEILYRFYVAAIFGAIALGVLGGAVNEAPATPGAIEWLRQHGPALLGIGLGVLFLAGLRSGARGGPLAIEPAEVQYVLLAPVDRGAALRPAALRQLRVAAVAGAAVGAILGSFVFRRFPGSPVEWIGALAGFGALVPACVLGGAFLASGRRMRMVTASAIGALLVAWSGLDLGLGTTTAPGTILGEVATLPLQDGSEAVLAALGVAIVAAMLAFGLAGIGGILLGAARRRSELAAVLRFSASVQDLRAVILLRRQLASERPRRRPWLALSSGAGPGAVWRRAWQSYLRWPGARIARVLVLSLVAGALAAGAWSAATLALMLPGLILFVVALDLVEPLAQESDHPSRRRLLPVPSGRLIQRHIAAPIVAIAGVILFSALGAVAVGATAATAFAVALAALPLSVALACCAALSATTDPYEYMFAPPELSMAISAGPVLSSALVVGLPLLGARAAESEGGSAGGAMLGASIALALLSLAALALLRIRFDKRDGVSG